jgi:hypothetical protein
VSPPTHPPPPPPHVSQDIDVVDTMFTSGVSQLDLDDSVLLSLIFDIGTDRPSTSSWRDTNVSGFGGGPS